MLAFTAQLASTVNGQGTPLDKVAPYRWSEVAGASTSKQNLCPSTDVNGTVQGKEPLFDQIVRPSEFTFDERSAEGKFDSSRPVVRSKQSGVQPKVEPNPGNAFAANSLEKINLAVTPPGAPWVRVDTSNQASNLCLCMVRSNPNILLLLAGEAVGVEFKPDVELLVKLSKAKLLAISPQAVFANEKEETIGGIHGHTFEASMMSPEGSQYWLIWVGTRNGYNYELALAGSPFNSLEISDAARDLRRGIRQIDPNRIAHKPPSEIITKYQSKAFGYDVDLTGLGWVKMTSAGSQLSTAEVCAQTGKGSGLVVIAVPMPGRVPDMDILAKSVVACTGLEHNGTEIVRSTPYKFGDLECREIETIRKFADKKVLGRMRLIADERCAYVAFGWSISDFKDEAVRVRKSLDTLGVHPHREINIDNLTAAQRSACANLLSVMGARYYTSGDLVGALDFCRSSMRLAPTNEIAVSNYLEVLSKLDRHDEALRYLNEHKTIFANNLRFRVLKARLLAQKGDAAGARATFAELIADGYMDNAILTAYLESAIASKAYDEALTTIAEVMKKRPNLQVKRMQATLYTLKGEHEKSIELLKQLRADYPDNVDVAVDLATAYELSEKYDAGIAVTQGMLDSGKQDEAVLIAHGRLQLRMGRPSDAKQTFERARELYPGSEHVVEALKLASSQLGEGENSSLKRPIEAVKMPPAVAQAINAAADKLDSANDNDAEVLERVVGLQFESDNFMRETDTQRVKVTSAAGVARHGMISCKIDPIVERLYVNRLVVTDDHGRRVAQGAVENYFLTDEKAREASNWKCLKIPVPGLKPGYSYECTITREIRGVGKDLPFREIALAGASPTRISVFYVIGDTKQLKCKASNGVSIESGDHVLYAIASNVAPLRYEPHQPAIDTFSPVIWLAASGANWETEGRNYLKLIDDKLAVDETTRSLAQSITAKCATNRQKLAAIAEHVQQGYTYHAIEFGRRARVPNAAAKTIALKYGDCKDHALLTRQMLAAVGIRADLALARSTGDIVSDLPSLDQFDHMVVFVPAGEIEGVHNSMDGIIVDATNKDANLLLDTPCGLENRSLLVLDAKRPRLVHTPRYPENAGQVTSKRSLSFEISPAGSVDSRVSEEVTFGEYVAPGMRAFFRHFDAETRREAIQNLVSENGPIRVRAIEALNVDANNEPLRIKLEYSIPYSFRLTNSPSSGKSLVGSLPCVWETQYALAQAVDGRKTPFEISMPYSIHSTVTFNVPDGYQFSELDDCNKTGSSKFRSWSSHASLQGKTVTIDYHVHLAAGRYPADAYEQFYNDSNDSLAVLRAPLSLRSEDSAVGTAQRPAHDGGIR